MSTVELGLRWTIGDVRERGFTALRLSIAGAYRLFGDRARYVVYVNSIDMGRAIALTGDVAAPVLWERAPTKLPEWLRPHLGPGMAQGVAWKLLPLRRFPHCFELSLDNDVVLWSLPPALRRWLDDGKRPLLAADVHPAFGQFRDECGPEGMNTGIRGLPPGYDLAARLRATLTRRPLRIDSELDEQGLQVASMLPDDPYVVPVTDVSICSPFPPHADTLGLHGAHFVGINTRILPFATYYGRPSEVVRAQHFDAQLPRVLERLRDGVAPAD